MHIPTAAQGRYWGLRSYPPGMCTETKPSAAETEPSAIGTEEPLGGFLISLLKGLRSLDPQVDNVSRQSRGTVQQWKGTAHLHATGAFPKSFSLSNNVTTPFGGHHCPNSPSLQPWKPSLSLQIIYQI